ncbi:MAG: 3-deoxy-D-manno-octulosonic acid transferase [Alphaproteobacteria bacterium]|nr:3-deoxy-D-manno-octulosonic acid transferase [Alphaproteobacteria bacterium]
MMLALYRGLTGIAGPLIEFYLRRRVLAGKEDAARLAERRGVARLPRPVGPLVWLHAASVGEAMSIIGLTQRLRREYPAASLLVTTGTVTSAALLAERLPAGAIHHYAPVDLPAYVDRFLAQWRPDLALWVESELWPNLVMATAAAGIPMLLLNARMSTRSYARWQRWPGLAKALLGRFAVCLAQSATHAERLANLGARRVVQAGNLKFTAEPLPVDAIELAGLEGAIGARPRWLAASTHAGEEAMVAAAHRRLVARHPGLLTMIAPRHPARGPALEAELAGSLKVRRRATGALPLADTDIYLADTLGELGLFYRAAGIAFIGGSLVPHGGQNLLEPARLGCALLHGPYVENFAEVAEGLRAQCAAEQVGDLEELVGAVDHLLADPGLATARAAAAAEFAQRQADVIDRVLAELAPFLARLPGVEPSHARA